MSTPSHSLHAPVGGELWTLPMRVLLGLVGLGAAMALWRFAAGIGAVANLNDGYPWGLWIAFDVVTGTALGCGGYAVALLVYILNKGQYHPLVRPALLTSLLGYGLAVVAVTIDLGRFWDLWKVPIYFWRWSGSPQLEVALCVATYVAVLLVELSPAAFEKWQASGSEALRAFSRRALGVLDGALVWIVALGLLLPTMHQSSLGTMMMLPGPRLHPLWQTSFLPLLFLVNAILMGYAAVVLESAFSARAFGRRHETGMLAALSKVAWYVGAGWFALRVLDILVAGELPLVASRFGLALLLELGLLLGALALLASEAGRQQPARQFKAALLLALGGMVYRLNVYLIGFSPGEHWSYFPAVPEFLITVGIVAAEVLLYVAAVKTFPILASSRPEGRA